MTADDPMAPIEQLRSADLTRLWAGCRERLERNGRRLTSTPLRLADLDPPEVDAVCALLGRRRPSKGALNVDLRVLDRTLRSAPGGAGLVEVLEAIGGPLRDRPAERDERARKSEFLWLMARAHPAADHRRVRDWLESVRRRGRLTRLDADDPHELLGETLDAVLWLIEYSEHLRDHPLPLSTLAAVQLGDAHALDPKTALGDLVADGLQFIGEVDGERAGWAAFGIQLDRVNSSALVLGLPGIAGSLCGAATATGQPLRVTWRMVETGFGLDLDAVASTRIFLCENPAIVSMAADGHGPSCAALVCTGGMPAGVTGALLELLSSAGGDLRVHTDFDYGGVAIARHVIDRFGAAPWRLGRASYLRAIEGPSSALDRPIGETPWDPGLADAMNEHRLAVHEEVIASTLLDDLAAGSTH